MFLDPAMRFYSQVQNLMHFQKLRVHHSHRLPTVIHRIPTKFYNVI